MLVVFYPSRLSMPARDAAHTPGPAEGASRFRLSGCGTLPQGRARTGSAPAERWGRRRCVPAPVGSCVVRLVFVSVCPSRGCLPGRFACTGWEGPHRRARPPTRARGSIGAGPIKDGAAPTRLAPWGPSRLAWELCVVSWVGAHKCSPIADSRARKLATSIEIYNPLGTAPHLPNRSIWLGGELCTERARAGPGCRPACPTPTPIAPLP